MALSRAVLPVIVLIVALAASGCGGSSDSSTPTETQTTDTLQSSTSPEPTTTAATTTAPSPAPQPEKIIIRVVGGKPEGGIARPKMKKGERVVLIVESDTADEVHFHGYDISRDVAAGGTARIPFVAKIQGRFEVELENSGVMLAELTVE